MDHPNDSASLATITHAPRISDETYSRVNELLDWIGECGDDQDLHNTVIPAIQQAGVPIALQERIITAIHRKLKFWDNPLPIARLRALIFPPPLPRATVDADALPAWAKSYCFVANGNRFYNTDNGKSMDMIGFQAIFGEKMPVNAAGRRDNAAERCLHFWGMPKVDEVGYRPDCGPFYEWDGARYANSYSPSSLPAVATQYTTQGLAGIAAFQHMLYDMCGRRDDVYLNLLYWYAHNVQHPGVKIRWAPIVKGIHGDGKTLAIAVLRSAMGYRNLSTTSNSNIANSGGFTDWAVRGAVNVIEEIMLTGKARHQLYNAMKEFVSNDVVDVNPKGAKPHQTWNSTNHYANTNHNDALPLESTDRRWFVIFTPWPDIAGMLVYCGLDAAGWKARTDAIDYAKNQCAGELRAWLLSITIPATFDINGSAMMTPEKRRMMASSEDEAESAAKSIIVDGAHGVTARVFSSAHLSRLLEARSRFDSFDMPQGKALHHMFTRMGFSNIAERVKWNGETCRIWIKNGVELTNDEIRCQLDQSSPQLSPP